MQAFPGNLTIALPYIAAEANSQCWVDVGRGRRRRDDRLPRRVGGMPHDPHTVVFDLFGVIACTQSEEAKRRIEQLAGLAGPPFWEAYWAGRPDYDAGQRGVDYWALVGKRLNVRFAPDAVAALIEADLESWTTADDRMVALVAELAGQGRPLGLLS